MGLLTTPVQVLREAIRAVPAVKYALGVAGVLAAVAVIKTFGLSWQLAAIGVVVMLLAMTALSLFATFVHAPAGTFQLPVKVFVWFALLMFIAFTLAVFLAVIDFPRGTRGRLGLSYLVTPERTPTPTTPATSTPITPRAGMTSTSPTATPEVINTPTVARSSKSSWSKLDRTYHVQQTARVSHHGISDYSYFISDEIIDTDLGDRELEVTAVSVNSPGVGKVLSSPAPANVDRVGFDLEVLLGGPHGNGLAGQHNGVPDPKTLRNALQAPVRIDGAVGIGPQYSGLETTFRWNYSTQGHKTGGPIPLGFDPELASFTTDKSGLTIRIFAWTLWGNPLSEFRLDEFDVHIQGRQRAAE